MLETIAFDPREIQDGSVVDTSDCSSSPTFEQIAYFAENATWFDFAYVIFTTGEIGASHPAEALGEEIESSRFASLTYNDIFGRLLQWLAHCSNELQLTFQDLIGLQRYRKQITLLCQNVEQILCYTCLKTWFKIVQKSIELLLEVQAIV